jgi:hypothetical protein
MPKYFIGHHCISKLTPGVEVQSRYAMRAAQQVSARIFKRLGLKLAPMRFLAR